jgi:hypothetical protein
VLKEAVITTFKIFGLLPAAIVGLAALRKIADETGFDKGYPYTYARITTWINTLLYILFEHWFGCILISAVGGTAWAFLVVEPKRTAKTEFDALRNDRFGE